jgi:hypothetical protein
MLFQERQRHDLVTFPRATDRRPLAGRQFSEGDVLLLTAA